MPMGQYSWIGGKRMKLKKAEAPHLRQTERVAYMSLDLLIALVPLCIFSSIYYGLRPVLLVLTGLVTAVVCELLGSLVMRRRPTVADGNAAVIGGLVGAMMSPITPYWVPAVAAAFAILVVKMPFGGTGRHVFHPAAAALALCAVCFPTRVFTYPDPGLNVPIPLGDTAGVITALSPAEQLNSGAQISYHWITLLQGNFAGPIGATAIAVQLACMLYLFARHTASPLIVLPYLLTCAAGAALFPRTSGGVGNSVLMELCSGMLLFSGIYLLTDTVTAPRYWLGRVVYGILAGVLVMTMRHFGRSDQFPCTAFFAVLLVNALAPVIDRWCWRLVYTLRRRLQERMERRAVQ